MRSKSRKKVAPGKRVLCLWNELLAEDAFGQVLAEPFAQTGNTSRASSDTARGQLGSLLSGWPSSRAADPRAERSDRVHVALPGA